MTILMFGMYLYGRIWSIRIKQNEVFETLEFVEIDEFLCESLEVGGLLYEDAGHKALSAGPTDENTESGPRKTNLLRIQFSQPINWLKVFATDAENFNEDTVCADHVLFQRAALQSGAAFYLGLTTPEGVQRVWVEFERYDFSQCRVWVTYSGISGDQARLMNRSPNKMNRLYLLVR